MMGGRAHGDEGGRRRLPQLLLLSVLGFLAACRAYASVDAPAPEPAPESEQQEYLYMMTAGNATFVPGGGDHDGVLTLDGFNNETIAFTDRPGRDAFPISTEDFVAAAFAPVDGPEDNSFYADPPNAAFSCPLGSGEVARAVYVLRAPSESDSDVAFEVQVLYASVPGAIECGGPAVRPNRHTCGSPRSYRSRRPRSVTATALWTDAHTNSPHRSIVHDQCRGTGQPDARCRPSHPCARHD